MTVTRPERPPAPTASPQEEAGVPWWHLAPIAVVLLASSFVVGHEAYVFIDEAALLAQVDLVGDGSWEADRRLLETDPDGAYTPMARSTVTDDGFAPFANHPLHVLLATAAWELGGHVGIRMLSVAGVLGAVAAAGTLAASLGRRHAAVAMWVAGIGSPLVFDANLVVGHAPAAAVTGALFVAVFRWHPTENRRFALRMLAVFALVAVGALLRSEVVLLGVAIGAVAAAQGVLRRRTAEGVVGVAAAAGAVFAYLLEPWWIDRLIGTSPGEKVIAASSRGGVSGARDGAFTVLVGRGQAGWAVVLAVALAVAAAALLRIRRCDARSAAVLGGAGVVIAAIHLGDPAIVPGIVWAFPLLAVGLVAVSRRQPWTGTLLQSALATIVFAAAVLVTQYSVGGGAEWGWRYVAVALPAIAAVLAVPLVDLASVRSVSGRIAVAGIVTVGLLVPLSGILAQRRTTDRVEQLLTRTDDALVRSDADVIVATQSSFGRYVWPRSIAGDVVSVAGGEDELADLLAALKADGVDRVLLVWSGTEPTVPPDEWRPAGERLRLLELTFDARAYALETNTRSPS